MSSPRSRISGAVTILCGAVCGGWMAWAQVPGRTSHPGAKERARITVSQMPPKLDGDHLKQRWLRSTTGPVSHRPRTGILARCSVMSPMERSVRD
jgi:hypothetical protein